MPLIETSITTYFRTATESSDGLLTVAEACDALRIKRPKLYAYLNSLQLSSVKLGSRRLIPRSAIRDLSKKLTIEAVA